MLFKSRIYYLIGNIITSDERQKILKKAFVLLKSMLPDDSFYNSSSGPSVIMTDNCDGLHRSPSYNWPDITLFPCTFHKLQRYGDACTKRAMA